MILNGKKNYPLPDDTTKDGTYYISDPIMYLDREYLLTGKRELKSALMTVIQQEYPDKIYELKFKNEDGFCIHIHESGVSDNDGLWRCVEFKNYQIFVGDDGDTLQWIGRPESMSDPKNTTPTKKPWNSRRGPEPVL